MERRQCRIAEAGLPAAGKDHSVMLPLLASLLLHRSPRLLRQHLHTNLQLRPSLYVAYRIERVRWPGKINEGCVSINRATDFAGE
jgi:hypothetical protein